ncbi:glycosyltransferase [Apibacter sp. HY039]|uniref:glycosyltransferase n=1 Tax=Apibacter sp. HY039 TaxID=2501476 RepID=UPI000FEC1AA1|nr:glycosyltransferase [Apibacter sp. HY039]
MKTSTSLVISTYNNSDILNLVLKSINIQSLLPDEIIIADCSSNYESEIIISAFTLKTKIPVIHIKQSGNKLLKAEILNKAIAKCKSEYIIQIHDDCILHKHFIKDHIHSRKYNTFLFGTIIPINQKKTDYIIKNDIYTFSLFSGKIKKRINNIYLPFFNRFHKPTEYLSNDMTGNNLSYWKKDFIDINGFNEQFNEYAGEDSDFCQRLLFSSVWGKKLQNCGIIYHFNSNTPTIDKNSFSLIKHTRRNKIIYCPQGVDKYLGIKKSNIH